MADERTTRRYDNSNRRQQAEATRLRIVDAGARLLMTAPIRDWANITISAVADRAGVHERTVYRHFGNDRGLRDAVMAYAEQAAGVDLESVSIDDLGDVTARVLRFAAAAPSAPAPDIDPTLHEADTRRRAALVRAVVERTPHWTEAERMRAAAVLDVLWSFAAFERLRAGWSFESDDAVDALTWAIDAVVASIDADSAPGATTPSRHAPAS